jgi:hypothetical protein
MSRTYQPRSANALFERADVGAFQLSNRIVMAPLTRNRAGPGLVPSVFAADYYRPILASSCGLAPGPNLQLPSCWSSNRVRICWRSSLKVIL